MPKTYQGIGIQCVYPDNWTVSENVATGEETQFTADSVIFENPNGSFFSISKYPWTYSPSNVIAHACKALQAEYAELEIEPDETDLSVADSHGVEIRFFLLDLLVVCRLRAFSLNQGTYLVEQQGEDRDYQTLESVFDAMIETVIQSLDSTQGLSRLHESNDAEQMQ